LLGELVGSPLLYVDTNVIMDAIEDRKNIFGNDIGTPAFKLFKEAISCKYHIIISAFTLYELRKKCKVDTTMFFEVIKQKRIHVGYDKEDEGKARLLSESNFDDALHVVIAERENADCIITRNVDDFKAIRTKIPIRKPEQLI